MIQNTSHQSAEVARYCDRNGILHTLVYNSAQIRDVMGFSE
jgi:hypothetical protein